MKFLKSRRFFVLIAVLVFLIGLTVGLILIFTKDKDKENQVENIITTSNPTTTIENSSTNPSTDSSSINPSTLTQSQESTTPSTTVEIPQDLFEIILKSEWNSTVQDKVLLKNPVKRVIVLETITDECFERQSCLNFLWQRQRNFRNVIVNYIFMNNLPENFLISSDGTIYEGRGFYEGQHTYDQTWSSYNINAIGVSFICETSHDELNEKQTEAFKYFLEKFLSDGKIEEDYQLYHRVQHVGGKTTPISETVKKWDHWKESKELMQFIKLS